MTSDSTTQRRQRSDPSSDEFADPDVSQQRSRPSDGYADIFFRPLTDLIESLQWTARQRKKTSNARRLQLFISYAPDWILTILLGVLLSLINKVHGFRREFSLTDTSIQHTHATHERVPVAMLVVYCFVCPVVIQAVISLGVARSFWDFHSSFLGLVLSHALTLTTTTIVKVCVGRPRPDLIDRCQPIAGSADAPVYGLSTDAICTNPASGDLVTAGFRSFPSGHSSSSFAGLAFLSLYLAGKLHLFGRRGYAGALWIVFIPLFGASLVGISRTMDYRHHYSDVIAGSLLGLAFAVVTYHMYYPPLTDPRCHKPWAPRVPREFRGLSEHSTPPGPGATGTQPLLYHGSPLSPGEHSYSEGHADALLPSSSHPRSGEGNVDVERGDDAKAFHQRDGSDLTS